MGLEASMLLLLLACTGEKPAAPAPDDSGTDATPAPWLADSTGVSRPFGLHADDVTVPETVIGCTTRTDVVLRNDGPAAFDILALALMDPEMVLDVGDNEPPPWTLGRGDTRTVHVLYSPTDEIDETVRLVVDTSLGTATVPVREDGAILDTVSELHTVAGRDLDLLFVLDTRSEMDRGPTFLAALPALVDALRTSGVDYRVTVVTDPDGCPAAELAWVDGTMDAAAQVDALTALATPVDGDAATEAGFTTAERALANTADGGCYAGFLRDDPALHVIGVTTGPEQSPSPWSTYVSLFQSYEAAPGDLVVDAWAGDVPDGCEGAEPGSGWFEATMATGGQFSSVCLDDWSAGMEGLVADAVREGFTVLPLEAPPLAYTLGVYIDGAPASGWSYSDAEQAVVFYAPLAVGTVVDVQYVPVGCSG